MTTYRIDLAYDGTGFRGYALQPDVRTVQGVLEEALRPLLGEVETVVAGRTDAGVHALGQVVSLVSARDVPCERLRATLGRRLPADVAVTGCMIVDDGFNARFSAISRTYRYRVLSRPSPDPLRRLYTWHVRESLDVDAMDAAAADFVGEHDFASFCRAAPGRSTVRTVRSARWSAVDDEIRFEVTAAAFCHQMVRSMVAVCVDVGRGRMAVDVVPAILAAHDRNAARGAAPPHGLALTGVEYR